MKGYEIVRIPFEPPFDVHRGAAGGLAMSRRFASILLAAGSGSRFGGGKLLTAYAGGELIDGALRAAFAAPVELVVAVTGYDAERVAESIDAFAARTPGPTLQRVYAESYAKGMAASLQAGVRALPAFVDAAFVFLGDMPRVPPEVAARLAAALGEASAAAPFFKGARGHPVLFTRKLFPALLALAGDRGAAAELAELGDDLARIDVEDEGVVFDVDRWADLAR